MNIQSFIENTIDDVDYAKKYSAIDGRNNRTVYAYDAKGNLVSTTDAVGAVTAYGYDVMGQTVAVTNALGNVTVYEYDLRGNKTYEGGATYPVRYTYDVFGNRISMTTYRDEAIGIGDTTTWTYDEASGVLLAKTYADGKGLIYTYTDDGRLATRTNARGIVTTYTYDDWGQLLAIDYADATPDIVYAYDAMGRQTSATDAAGTTTFTYAPFGQLISEQVSGLYSKTLTRHWDAFGRNAGYSVDGTRKNTLTYDPATGRLATMGDFAWEYLPGSHLKSRLTYPNGATAVWEYEPTRDLLARVTNTINGAVASRYTYTNDLLGRRTGIGKSGSMMASDETQPYGYNVRDELISGQNQTYAYDDIGNRTTAEGKTYAANNLNQYTAIDDFTPEYDADGNQTLVKTETGVWSVVYNAENRPVRWESGDAVITMAFDRLGRRVDYCEMRAGQVITHFRFVYDNFLCIQRLDVANGNAVRTEFVWDPTEPIATRPLVMRAKNWGLNLFYTYDGNKNVSEVFYHAPQNGIAAHYDYAPFGAVTRTSRATRVSNRDLLSENPFRFSSEVHDFTLGLIYYNYRHYNPINGNWLQRDPLESFNCYSWTPLCYDFLGLTTKTQLQQLLDFFIRCSTEEENQSPVLREKYRKAANLLTAKMLGRDYKEKSEELLNTARDVFKKSTDLIEDLERSWEGEEDVEKKKQLEKVIGTADDILDALSVVNAASGDVSPTDTAKVLNYFIKMASEGFPKGMGSYFGYLSEGINVSIEMIEAIDGSRTEIVLQTIKSLGGDCPCSEAKTALNSLGGDLQEIRRIF